MNIEQINKKIEELENKKKELLAKQEQDKNKPIIIKAYGKEFHIKEFQIHMWEDKPFKDFPIPKGFQIAEANDVDKLINDELFIPQQFKWYVFKQRYPKINKQHGLSRLYLSWNLYLRSNYEFLANSYSDGRVILVKVGK